MKIIEPKEMKCKECGKILKESNEGFGIPVFNGFHFKREWLCKDCFVLEIKERIDP